MTAIASISNSEAGSSVRTKLNSVITLANANNLADLREAMVDADKTFTATYREVYLGTTLTAPRTLTLPSASAFSAGTTLIFLDEIGGVTSTNTVTITRAGADNINGATTLVIKSAYSVCMMVTDGTSKWTAISTLNNVEGTWSPTLTGFSADPTGGAYAYQLTGGWCTIFALWTGNGTSNATTKTMTLPYAAASGQAQQSTCRAIDNGGGSTLGFLATRSGSNVLDIYPTITLGNWTASGSARYFISSFKYKVA